MLKDVWISFNSIHGLGDEEEDRLEFNTDGYYYYEDGVGCLSYEESEVTGLEGTRTSMIVMPDRVVVDRDGLITSRMEFKEGSKSSFLYDTPFGQATMGIDTRKIRHSMNENGGSVEIDYVVDMEHAVVMRNKFEITVRETENRGTTNG